MVIEGDVYKLTPTSEHCVNFTLELLYNIGGKNPRKEFKIAGYGYSLEGAIKAIIAFKISDNHKDDVITLKQYLNEFKQISEEIKQEISNYM